MTAILPHTSYSTAVLFSVIAKHKATGHESVNCQQCLKRQKRLCSGQLKEGRKCRSNASSFEWILHLLSADQVTPWLQGLSSEASVEIIGIVKDNKNKSTGKRRTPKLWHANQTHVKMQRMTLQLVFDQQIFPHWSFSLSFLSEWTSPFIDRLTVDCHLDIDSLKEIALKLSLFNF